MMHHARSNTRLLDFPCLRMSAGLAAAALLAIATGVTMAQAQSAQPKEEPKQQEEKPAPRPVRPPTLDDLLDIPQEERPERLADDDPGAGDPDLLDPNRPRLDRALSATEATEMFQQAIKQMSDVADRLQLVGDLGLTTQRIQEEIIRKLDTLIESSEQQGGSSGSSSSQSQSGQREQQRTPPAQQQAQGQQDSQSDAASSSPGEAPPGSADGPRQDLLDAARAAWGSLPDRIRDTLLQGSSDRFSSIYRGMTEEYYRRLAEEAPDR